VNYEGKLLNGTVFDSSYGRQPAEFGLDQVIKGLDRRRRADAGRFEVPLLDPGRAGYGENGTRVARSARTRL
jgi:FKBP-type peptidyl-prolyl cis-trans isomerase FkpA